MFARKLLSFYVDLRMKYFSGVMKGTLRVPPYQFVQNNYTEGINLQLYRRHKSLDMKILEARDFHNFRDFRSTFISLKEN